ncbi:Uncharacterized ACR, COG1399 [Listeria fleischmannii subsp. fleischmannii]|uniref:Uncharacterized ACR, COG1399 n=2 Tax=Listeria fleischmannii TaxID=1069827 RepID=A0A2X3GFT5_9LIST|nr:Uncharacterized ACR, COG1399 [Listeria fleischmannii subsp. fleischmannii]
MMKWSLSQLKKYRDGEFEIDETIDLTEFLKENNHDVREASPVHVTGTFEIKRDEVIAHLTITGEWTLPCARTLKDVIYPYEIKTIETFVKNKDQVQDESWHLMDQDTVDLVPVLCELLLVEIPMQVFSEETDEESALPKGNDWELQTEETFAREKAKNEPKTDPRLAGLADFFNEKKED